MTHWSPMLGRVLVLAALLFAQHLGLRHHVWHAAGASANPAASTEGDVSAKSAASRLCEFHGSFDTVLGAVDSAPPAIIAVALFGQSFESAPSQAISLAGPTPA